MELKRLWMMICRRKGLFLLISGGLVFVTMAWAYLATPIYAISSKVMINLQSLQPQFVAHLPTALGKLSYLDADNVIDTYRCLLSSQSCTGKVIQQLNITDKRGKLLGIETFANPGPLRLIRQKKGVRIRQIESGEVLEVKGYSSRMEEAVKIANGVADSFLALCYNLNVQEATRARKLLEKQVIKMKKELALAEAEESRFRKEKEVIDLDEQRRILISEISSLGMEKVEVQQQLEGDLSSLSAIQEALGKQPKFRKVQSAIEANPMVELYKDQMLRLQMDLAQALIELTSEHPEVKGIKAQIGEAEATLRQEMKKVFASEITGRNSYYDSLTERYGDTEIEIIGLRAREKVIAIEVKRREKELSSLPRKEVELEQLTRKTDSLSSTVREMMSQVDMARVAEEMEVANATIVERAAIPENPRKYIYMPKKKVLLPLSLFLGTSLALFLVLLREYLDESLRTVGQVREILDRPVLGTIPLTSRRNLRPEKLERGPIADAFSNLQANIALTSSEFPSTISILSSGRGEGRSTVVSLLSSALAHSGRKTILIDANLHSPSLHRIFRLSNNQGLSTILRQEGELEGVKINLEEGPDLLLAGPPSPQPLRLLESNRLGELIKKLREGYEVVIFDTPALELGTDGLIISRHCDATIFLIAWGELPGDRIKEAVRKVKELKVNILGTIFNKVKEGV